MDFKLTFMAPSVRILFLMSLVIEAHAVDLLVCETNKFHAYADAKASYQIELANLIEEKHPSVMSAAKHYMKDQLLRIDRKRSAFDYLKTHNHVKINFDKSLNRWVDLSMSEQIQMSSVNARYAELSEEINDRNKTTLGESGHQLRAIMRNDIISEKDFQVITHKLSSEIDRLNHIKCQH